MIKVLFGLIAVLLSADTMAGCLDGLTSTQTIGSKIRGIYVNSAENSSNHYVIIDKETCTAGGGSVSIGEQTKSYYYLLFKETDKLLQSVLLTAYSKGETLEFRIVAAEGGYNRIAYVVTPKGARSQ